MRQNRILRNGLHHQKIRIKKFVLPLPKRTRSTERIKTKKSEELPRRRSEPAAGTEVGKKGGGSGAASSLTGILPQRWVCSDRGQPTGGDKGTRLGATAARGLWNVGSIQEEEGQRCRLLSSACRTRAKERGGKREGKREGRGKSEETAAAHQGRHTRAAHVRSGREDHAALLSSAEPARAWEESKGNEENTRRRPPLTR